MVCVFDVGMNIHKLQCAQNSLSPVALPHHPGSASSRLSHLHWLPVHRLIQYKIALLTYKSLSTSQPPYLRNLLHMYQPSCCLRSANQNLLSIPFCRDVNETRDSKKFLGIEHWISRCREVRKTAGWTIDDRLTMVDTRIHLLAACAWDGSQ